jgi:4-amino-4-deoxy-L-arabinose transferase-like glycosyltransferase
MAVSARNASADSVSVGPIEGRDATPEACGPPASPLDAFCDRHFWWLACGVLGLALFNLVFRIGREILMQWDESLYAVSAWEMLKSGNWVATTFLGELDYYNTKPPLNVWLLALSFKAFGYSLVSLRIACTASAWASVAVLIFWVRRCAGSAIGLLSGLVLATCFGYIYVHSGRNANTDASFALIFVLMAVALWASDRRPWHAVWIGPLLAATFLLRGPAALMFVVFIAGYWIGRQHWLRGRWRALAAAAVLFLVPVIAWATARWRIDQERFFIGMFGYDLVERAVRPIEGHPGSVFYYLNILVKHQYDWILAAVAGALVAPGWPRRVIPFLRSWRTDAFKTVLMVWAVVGLVVPTIISTKVPWYLNHSYPVFAIGVAAILVHAFRVAARQGSRRRAWLLAGVAVVMLATAEAKLVSYSYNYRDLSHSAQGLLLSERDHLAGHRVFRANWDRSEIFEIGAIIGAERGLAAGLDDFLAQSRPGDCYMVHHTIGDGRLSLLATNGRNWLYRRDH